jgi:hypothetical protein
VTDEKAVLTTPGKEDAMSLGRLASLCGVLLIAVALASCSSSSPSSHGSDDMIEVDLSTFPDTGQPVPDQTVLADQWASIGITFDSEPEGVDAIVTYFGNEGSLFFSPDVQHAIAIFQFVEPASRTPVNAVAFELLPWFNPGESAELVGLDEEGAEVVVDTVTPDDIGSESKGIKMSIDGTFRTVEWRTHGDPGIAAGEIAFELE